MMRLSTLWKVDATVDAARSSPLAERIVACWNHDAASVRFFRSSANFLYLFRHEGKNFFLRFADSCERSREAIEAEIDLVNWLAATGLEVATPIRSKNGNYVETVEAELGTFHAVVFPALEGDQLEIDDLDEAHFQAWGAALGKLHATVKGYSGPALSARKTWREHLHAAKEYIPTDAPAMLKEWEQIMAALNALAVDSDNFGLIHFDFELDNLVWNDQRIAMLDFDDCARYWFVADIALALRDLFAHGPNLDDPSFRAFVQGYSANCPLDEEGILQIPLFLRVANLLLYASRARSLDLPDDPTYPDWLNGLRRKLQTRMEEYRMALEKSTL
jgi:Ser/Thr protein kinase RdoA (MazF antagonist)